MGHKMLTALGIVIGGFIMTVSPAYAGGPWTQPQGKGYIQLSYTLIPKYSRLYGDNSSTIQLNQNISDQTLVAYLEYGVIEDLTTILEIPVKRVQAEPINTQALPARSLTAAGNISLAAKRNFVRKTILISGQMKIDFKAFNSSVDIAQGLRSGVDAWGFMPSLSVGTGFKNIYVSLDTGLRLRTGDYSHEWLMAGEAGISLLKRLWIIGVIDIRESITTGTHDTILTPSGLYADNQEYFARGFKFILNIHQQFGLNFSRFGAYSGNLVARSPSSTLGVFFRW